MRDFPPGGVGKIPFFGEIHESSIVILEANVGGEKIPPRRVEIEETGR